MKLIATWFLPLRVPARLAMIVKGLKFYLKRNATELCVL
jgi:hypothetical protein